MTNGSRAFYEATRKVRDFLISLENVNTVTFGDIREVDLNKQTIFPLAHVMVDNVGLASGTMTFQITVLAMDIVHQYKGDTINDQSYPAESIMAQYDNTDLTYFGTDNEQDVLNDQLSVVNLLNQSLTRSQLRTDKFELTGLGSCEPFVDRFENKLAGWAYTFSAFVQNDINICE
jgi:Cu/Ag efflux protein CusF